MPSLPPRHAPDIDQDRLLAETSLVSIERHRVLGSTNDRAKSLAREGKGNLPALILADHQTAGRGRGANRWWTGPGSLAFTLLADTENWQIPPERIPLVALVAGIALVETVEPRLTGATACLPEDSDQRLRAGLHWPNDVYLGDRKLAGILVEMPRADRLVVGVGLNTNCRVAEAPKELRDRVATLLDVTEQVHDHTSLLIDWLRDWEKWVRRLPSHPEDIGQRADALCVQHGLLLRVRVGSDVHEGRCLGITPSGTLRLETVSGIREFHSGRIE